MATDLIEAALLYRSESERDFLVPAGPEVGLGQDTDNGIRVPFPGVSRHHAKLTYDGKSYWIEDVGSSNGTFLNGRRIVKRERLEHLDVLALGRKTELIFARRRTEGARVTRRGIKNAWLEIVDGLEAGTRREIPRGAITIGRSSSNNVVADSQLVSKIHVRLDQSGVQLLLIDLQSANGTFMNGEKVESKVLADGDEFTLGGVRSYRVHIEYGNMETSEVPRSVSAVAAIVQSLPIDWKTRIEWSPEEKAALEQLQGSRAKAAPSAAAKPPATPKEPAKAPPAERVGQLAPP
jgi:pSer/pThr/pTyr-binding forkhead associated (FHA) protein